MENENQNAGDAGTAGNEGSGSRWEPDAETQAQQRAQAAAPPVEPPTRTRARWRPSVPKNRVGLVGAAALLLVVSAGGGFAVGRATGDGHGHGDRVGLYSDHRGFDGGPGVGPGPAPFPPQGAPDDEQGQEDG